MLRKVSGKYEFKKYQWNEIFGKLDIEGFQQEAWQLKHS